MARGFARPVCSPIISWYSPLASENHASRVRRATTPDCGRGPRCLREIARVALVGRHGEDVAARRECGAHAGRRQAALRSMPATRLNCGRAHGKSPATSIASCFACFVASKRWM